MEAFSGVFPKGGTKRGAIVPIVADLATDMQKKVTLAF